MPKRRRVDPERKPRFCDPGACDRCLYIGEGDFFCDKHNKIVVSDWQPTDDYMACKKNSTYNRFRPSKQSMMEDNKDE